MARPSEEGGSVVAAHSLLDREELQAFYAASDHWTLPIVRVAVNTGMRRGEVLGLRWSDLSEEHVVVTVQHTRTSVGGAVVDGTTKSGKMRQFALGASARDALKAVRAQQAQWRLAAGRDGRTAPPISCSPMSLVGPGAGWAHERVQTPRAADRGPAHPLT